MLTPAEDSQVQYAMEATTVDGTAVNAATGLGGRQIIAKTGTTSNYLSGFFIGAIPQYTLVVGMFVNQQDSSVNSKDSLSVLGGGGFGGFWPANIWNTFAQAEFANLTPESFQSPQFSGQLWNQIGPLPKAPKKPAPKCTVTHPRQEVPDSGQGLPVGDADAEPSTQPGGFPTSRVSRRLPRRQPPQPRARRQPPPARPRRPACPLSPVAGTARRYYRADGERGQGGPGRRRGARRPAAGLAAVDDRVETTA